MKKNSKIYKIIAITLLIIFFVVNLSFLVEFPFIHSDESWLAGLSRNIMETGDCSVTEQFFDLQSRYPHAIKMFFHFIQIGTIHLFSYSVFSVRLISLIFGTASLYIMFLLGTELFRSVKYGLIAMVLLAIDVQFLYASHFARQEIIILFLLLLCIYLFLRNLEKKPYKNALMMALFTGIGIGIHPNSFFIACVCTALYAVKIVTSEKGAWKCLLLYLGTTAAMASIFVVWSFTLDGDFITHYLAYGDNEFDIIMPIGEKISYLGYYLKKIYYQISGTYYLPNLKWQCYLFPIAAVLSGTYAVVMRKEKRSESDLIVYLLMSIAAIFAGIVIIGRFSQLSIVFVIPLFWLLVVFAVRLFEKKIRIGLILIISSITMLVSIFNISPWIGPRSYSAYLEDLSRYVSSDSIVLANLNSDFYFENGKLHDYRNLSLLSEHDLSFGEYIKENHIEYLVISDELTWIYENRPTWDIIYGSIDYYEEMLIFLNEHCETVGSFVDNTYGVRIVSEIDSDQDFVVTIYRVVK